MTNDLSFEKILQILKIIRSNESILAERQNMDYDADQNVDKESRKSKKISTVKALYKIFNNYIHDLKKSGNRGLLRTNTKI